MREQIIEELKNIESNHNVKILFAIESGSRAWGFSSPDSDYDVRFIYVRTLKEYLRLDKTKDIIDHMLTDTLDINGWDLRKALQLLHSSNPTLFEWCGSPVVYHTTEAFENMKKWFFPYFSRKSGLYHYLNMAEGNYREYLKGETVKLKKYFYVLRPLLACRWILEKGTPPPMLFDDLKQSQLKPELMEVVDELLKIKMINPETTHGRRIDVLNEYIEDEIPKIKAEIQMLPLEEIQDWAQLNQLFYETLNLNEKRC